MKARRQFRFQIEVRVSVGARPFVIDQRIKLSELDGKNLVEHFPGNPRRLPATHAGLSPAE